MVNEPHDRRFELPVEHIKLPGENLIRIDKQIGRRNQHARKKNQLSAPFYNPSYDLVSRRQDVGVPSFSKLLPRKDAVLITNCHNVYDINEIEKKLEGNTNRKVPIFEKMTGRDDGHNSSRLESPKRKHNLSTERMT